MSLRNVPASRKGIAFALAFSTAAHGAVLATSITPRAPSTGADLSPAFDVSVEVSTPVLTPPDRPDPAAVAPRGPSVHAQASPLRTRAVAKTLAGESPRMNAAAREAPPPMPRFNLSLPGASSGAGSAKTAGTSNDQAPNGSFAPLGEREVDVPARLQRGGTPHYPPEALADEIEGDVQLELVVSTAGDVESVQVVLPAGNRFDEEAVASARNFRFSPAMKNGRPVRMRLRWTVGFRLR